MSFFIDEEEACEIIQPKQLEVLQIWHIQGKKGWDKRLVSLTLFYEYIMYFVLSAASSLVSFLLIGRVLCSFVAHTIQ